MIIEQYQTEAWKFAKYPNAGNNLAYVTLGLVGEFVELLHKIDKNLSTQNINIYINEQTQVSASPIELELGDVMWYLSAYCTELKIKITDIIYTESEYFEGVQVSKELSYTAVQCLGTISERVKKLIRDNDPNINYLEQIKQQLTILFWIIKQFIKIYKYTLNNILEKNIAKLKDRENRNLISGEGDTR